MKKIRTELQKLKDRVPKIIGEDDFFKAAVCIALIETEEGYDVLFEQRSDDIEDQPGDVCFPGGRVEAGESYEDAVVRECCEELLIKPYQIDIICASDHVHIANTMIYPYVGILKEYDHTFNKEEVADVFHVPLKFFLETEPKRYKVDSRIIPGEDFPYELIEGGRDYKWRSRRTEELFYQYDGHVIWGLTARMLKAFCELIS